MDPMNLFSQFGYPALISGALIWIIQGKLERIRVELEARNVEARETNLRLNAMDTHLKSIERDLAKLLHMAGSEST
jgi:hypothetical protein